MSNTIRELIREMSDVPVKTSAGAVIVRQFEDGPKVLGLKLYGSYDLPKGMIEDGEDPIEAMVREVSEESGISISKDDLVEDVYFVASYDENLVRKHGFRKNVYVFLVETQDDPFIRPNPETGIVEHHGFKWMTFDELEKTVYNYLRPAVVWARRIIGDYGE